MARSFAKTGWFRAATPACAAILRDLHQYAARRKRRTQASLHSARNGEMMMSKAAVFGLGAVSLLASLSPVALAAPQSVTKYHFCTAMRVDGTEKYAWTSRVTRRTGSFNEAISSSQAEQDFDDQLTRDGNDGYRISCRGPFESYDDASSEETRTIQKFRNDGWTVNAY